MPNRAAALPAAAAAAAVALAVSGCGVNVHVGPRSATEEAAVPGPVTAVQLEAGSGDIRIRTGAGQGATIHRTISYRGRTKPHPSQRLSGGVLSFVPGCTHCSIDYDLTVPAAAQVRIRTGSGSISVAGVAAADLRTGSGDVGVRAVQGSVRAHTGSGSIMIASIGTQADLRTSSGDIIATAVRGGTLRADTGSGSVTLKFSSAPSNVLAVTGSGDVRIMVPGGPYRVDHSTRSGDDSVQVPTDPSAPAVIVARTGSGSLHIAPAAGCPLRGSAQRATTKASGARRACKADSSRWWGSNPRPSAYKALALATELHRRRTRRMVVDPGNGQAARRREIS
jgi:hypothetical protein